MGHDASNIPDLDRKGYRNFGMITGGMVALLFGGLFPWLLGHAPPIWPFVVTAVLGGWAILAPDSLKHIYRPWMRLGLLLSKITTPIILGIVFYLVVTPMGLIRRAFGRDSLARKIDKQAKTYRVESSSTSGSLENPY